MKKIYFLALATLFGINAMAQQKSNVVVFAEDGETFFAFLNGVKQNTTAQSNVKIADIPGQGASLRVVFANSADQPLKQDLYFMDPNQEHTIKIKRDKKGVLKMKYFGAVPLAESTSSAPVVVYTATEAPANTSTTNTTGTVSNNTTTTTNTTGNTETVNMNTNMQVNDPNMNGTSNQTVTTTTTTTNSNTNGSNGNGSGSVNMNVGISENGLSMNMNVSGTGTGENGSVNMNVNGLETTETSSTTTTTTTTTSSSSSSGYSNNTTNGTGYTTSSGGCSYAMDNASFAKMKKTVSNNSFDDTKLSTAKTATKGSCLSTDQVKEIMLLFTMDDDRMAYAQYAYDYTVDKNNFYHLGEAFIYDGSKEDLNQFIESKR